MNRSQRRAAERFLKNQASRRAEVPQPSTAPDPVTDSPDTTPAVAAESIAVKPEISEVRLAANRANAQFSTGPTSSEGKTKVSRNALKTSLTGFTVLLPVDDAEVYASLVVSYQKEFQPVGPEETALVQSILDIRWRLERIPGLEMALLYVTRAELTNKDQRAVTNTDPLALELEIRRTEEKMFRNLHLQEQRLARRREREMAELLRLQQTRKARELEELNHAAQACLPAKHRSQSFDLYALGFEFSRQRFESHMATLTPVIREKLLKEALAQYAQTMQAAA